MQLTKDNLPELGINAAVYLASSFTIPEKLRYMCKESSYYWIVGDNTILKIYIHNPNSNFYIEQGLLFTEYKEAVVKMRELSIATIAHFNKHQFKDNPIIINE